MSRFDQDREELIRLIISLTEYARFGYEISTYNNCNTCKDKGCKYMPKLGKMARYNCPLWTGERGTE